MQELVLKNFWGFLGEKRSLLEHWLNIPLMLKDAFYQIKGAIYRLEIREEYNPLAVFMNIPYKQEYAELEIALWITIFMHELKPSLVRGEGLDKPRLCRICYIIQCCKYGITDLSFRRLNVAFELGLLKTLGKPTVVLIDDVHELDKDFSDYRAFDPIGHGMDRTKLIAELSKWMEDNWEGAKKDVDKRLIMRVCDLLIDRYKRNYNYSLMNLFYEEIEEFLKDLTVS